MRVRITGRNQGELFKNAARGIFSIITSIDEIENKQSMMVELKAETTEYLLVDWLNELIYLWQTKGIIFSDFRIKKINEGYIKAKILGEKFNSQRHKIVSEIKAATYHGLKIEARPGSWMAEVIFDV